MIVVPFPERNVVIVYKVPLGLPVGVVVAANANTLLEMDWLDGIALEAPSVEPCSPVAAIV